MLYRKTRIIKEDYQSDFDKGYQDAIEQLKKRLGSNKNSQSETSIDSIGGSVSSAIIDMEDTQREAEAIADALDDEEDGDLKDKAEEVASEAKDVQDELKKKLKSSGGKGGKHKEIDRDSIDKDVQIRIQKIKDFFSDVKNQTNINTETERNRRVEREEERKKEFDKWIKGRSDLRFLDSLNKLVRTQVARHREYTWKRPSKNIVPGSDVLRRGRTGIESKSIPLIAVFYDRSGSWNNPEMTAVGDRAISMLKENYERKGLIKLKLYYFADKVSQDINDRKLGGGTTANQLILDKIKEINATNVIILTDSDMDSTNPYSDTPFTGKVTKVPGGVYFLFKGGRCNLIMQYLKGERLTEAYDLK